MHLRSSFDKIQEYTSTRIGEVKLGQVLTTVKYDIQNSDALSSALNSSKAKYVIVGISEDVGVRANYGKGGTVLAYDNFLRYFVNVQKNQFINDDTVLILGEIDVADIQELSTTITDINKLRELCSDIDERMFSVIKRVVESEKIPIVIGGGHNNAYGNIKGTSLALNKSIEVLNIDPHADFRVEEGRHSGNGFRYAYQQNYLNKYGVWGLHENYNSQVILDSFAKDENLFFETLDNIIKGSSLSFDDFLNKFSYEIGLELDSDSIKNMPCSAISPVGFTEEEVLGFIYKISISKKVLYYHFTEGAPKGEHDYIVGKFLSYLVTSILKVK